MNFSWPSNYLPNKVQDGFTSVQLSSGPAYGLGLFTSFFPFTQTESFAFTRHQVYQVSLLVDHMSGTAYHLASAITLGYNVTPQNVK